MISVSANGLGASVSASASSAAAIAETATPARISDGPDGARPAKLEQEGGADAGPEQAARRQRRRKRGGQAPVERDHRAQPGGPGDPEQAGIRQRIAQRALQHRARQAQPAAHQDTQQRARQAKLPKDQPVRQRQSGIADEQGDRGQDGEQQRQPADHRASSVAASTLKGPAQMVSAGGIVRRGRPASAGWSSSVVASDG